MSEMNERQVGGAHYRSEYQHWDWVEDTGIGWMEACATKYVTRWRKKPEGTLGLEKAMHYIDKLIENHKQFGRRNKTTLSVPIIVRLTKVYAVHNGLTDIEEEICGMIASWQTVDHLIAANDAIMMLVSGSQAADDKIPF